MSEIFKALVGAASKAGLTVSALESCTGGHFADSVTCVSGSSEMFVGSVVTYSDAAKISAGVSAGVIEKYGVYSQETARAMAAAARGFFNTDIGVGITGTIGRADPLHEDSVPGEVHFSIASKNAMIAETIEGVPGEREAGKEAVCARIAGALLKMIEEVE